MKKLKIILGLLLALTLFGFKTTTVRAVDLWPFDDVWNDAKCLTDIKCTVRAAGFSGFDFGIFNILGKDYETLSASDLNRMLAGEWDRGLASSTGRVAGLAYSGPSIHVGDYVRTELADNLLNSQANAQTIGTDALSPIQPYWEAMRDIAYALFLVVMVVIGFMIMFRTSVSPRVVVTFTNALPRIVLGLVLITFSFPIIAFIVDVGVVFASELVARTINFAFEQQVTGTGVAEFISNIPTILIAYTIAGPLGTLISGNGEEFIGLSFAFIFSLGFLILFGLTLIRVLAAYAEILVRTIFSPILFLIGSLPGQEGAVSDFFKKITAKALVFPVTAFFVLLGAALTTSGITEITSSSAFERISGESPLLTGGMLGPLLGLIMLALAFKSPAFIEEAFGMGRPPKKK
jgi:hypothetical protein